LLVRCQELFPSQTRFKSLLRRIGSYGESMHVIYTNEWWLLTDRSEWSD
jgi:hypothetical protein